MGLSADPIPTLIVDGDRPLSGRLLPPFRDFTELELDQSEASFLTGTSPPPPSRSITIISEGLLPPPQRSLWEVLTPVRTLAGHVIFDGESAPPEVLIRLQLIGEPTISWLPSEPVKTEPDGTFSITAPEGEYVFALSRLPFGLVFKSVTQRNADLLTQPLRVWGSNPDEVVIHVAADSKNWSTVSGRVTGVDPGRAPVVFRLTGGDLAKSFETPIHADGTFSVSGVPQGQYSLTLGGAVSRNFSEKLIIAEVIGEGVHKAEDISGLEIVVPIDSDEPAIWRRSEP